MTEVYVITGAGGWLGKRVVRALVAGDSAMGAAAPGNRKVRALVRDNIEASAMQPYGIETITGDLRDPQTARQLTAGCEGATLIHLAGVIHPQHGTKEFDQVNYWGTRNLVTAAAAAGMTRTVIMSSNSSIGVSRNPAELFDEGSPYNPYMGYGRSKRKMEEWLRAQIGLEGMPEIVILRAPWFYGPDQPARQTRFFNMIKNGKFPLMGDGSNRRSMAYVDSLAFGILLAANTASAAGQIYWLADERPYPMHEVISTVQKILIQEFGIPSKTNTVHVPALISDFARVADWSLQSLGLYNQEVHVLSEMNLTISCSIDKAKRELGYYPLVDLREGMRRSIAWCLEQGIAI